ncbi:transcription-associated protein 1, partial [Dimargaris xerosporica]
MVSTGLPNCEVYAARLADPNLDIPLKNTIIRELRESFDVYQSSNYAHVLLVLFPVFRDILLKQSPVFVSNAPEQKLRSAILEIIHRFPLNETLKPYVDDILQICLQLIRTENEDNAVLCLKILVELHRSYKNALEKYVQRFLDTVKEIYRNVGASVRDVFEGGETPGPVTPFANPFASPRPMSPLADASDATNKPLTKSMWSFKVLSECPVIVVMLCQAYRKYNADNMPTFIPLIVDTLKLRVRQQEEASQAAEAQQQTFVGMSPTIKNRTSYLELIIAQVKTLSFLAFSLRNFSKAIQPYKQDLPTIVIHLLQDCPSEAASTRRELLIALRHILATDLRTAFVSKIDVLLSAEILIGRGVTSRETLRSIAFSTLADLVHHIRADLSPTQLARAVRMYADNLHDTTLASGIQSMSAKLLINLIDCIVAIPDKSVARQLLMQIFTTFTYKLESLSVQFVRVEHQYHQKSEALAQPADDNSTTTTDSSPVTWSVGSTAEQYFAIQLGSSDSHGDFVKETRFLIKNLVSGIKHAVFVLKHCNPPPPTGVSNLQEYNAVARGFTTNEMGIFVSLFRAGVHCFNYYGLSGASTTDDHGNSSSNSTATTLTVGKGTGAGAGGPGKFSTGSKEEKELLEHFASVFIYVDPAIFQEVFLSQMEFLFEMTLQNTPLITVPQFFLASDAVSQSFASICLAFLMKRMDQLGGDDTHYTSVMVQLFKLVFMAVTLFPNTNEAVLKPHIGHIITSCLKLSGKARNPADYFHLLRALFRSIGGGRFEMLYKEVLPLLQMLLETLNMLLATTHERRMRELFVEICLTVPVRLSVLLPYLSLLMRPLVLALEPGSELVGQGLRTLELCIDNLTQEFLDPIMTPVINGIMAALWKHLRPEPYDQNLSHTTVRILGKLGGRNRRMFQSFPKLQHCVPVKPALALSLALHGVDKPQVLPLEDGLRVATKVLEDPTVEFYYKEKALTLVTAQLALLVDWSGVTTSGLYQLRAWFQRVASREQGDGDASGPGPELAGGGAATDELSSMTIRRTIHGLHGESQAAAVLSSFQATQRSLKAQEEALAAVIYTLFSAATNVGLRERALDLIEQVVRYFAVWHATQFCSSLDNSAEDLKPDPDTPAATFANGVSSGPETATNYHAFVEALVRVLTAQSDDINHLGERALHLFYGTTKVLLNASTTPSPLPTLRGLLANRVSDPAVPSADMEVNEASGSSDDASFSLVARLSLFQELAQRFCSCCYMEDFVKKLGGCRGIHVLAIQLPLGRNWLLTRIVDFTKALLYILKDSATTEHYGKSSHVDQTTQTLFQVMRACWEHNQLPPALDSDHAKPTPADGLAMDVDSVEPKPTEPAKPLDPDSTNTPKPDPADGEQQVASPIAIGSAPPTTDVQSPQSPVPKPSASAGASPQPSLPKSDTNAGEPTLAKPTAPDAQANLATTNPGATIPGPDLSMSQETEFWRARFNSLIVLLITELTNPNNNVRQAVRECFQLLAELTHRQVSQLLTPVRERLLRPIFAKPLRALSTHMQIGNIDAITYCLSLRPPLLNISEALVRLLNEALALADAEDQALASRAPPMKCSGSLTSLRLVCLQLLATAMGSPEFMLSRQSLIQARIISVFFKSLYSKTPEIVDVANKGLKQVLTQLPKLPKELLQTGLRPILMSLSDHRRLSVHGLEALARMLELLTNYFKAEIGRKLLDHLNQLATPAMLLEASSRPLQDIEPIKVIVSILNIFHLLPPSAKIFLPELVTVTLQMESHLRRN